MAKVYRLVYIIVALYLVAGFCVTQGFGLVIRKSLEELTCDADCIVIGKVEQMDSRWNQERTQIYTYVIVSVRQYIKSLPEIGKPKEIIIKIMGGEVGDIGLKISDTPEFAQGEEVFLFVKIEKLPIFRVAGLFQGKYTVEEGKVKNKILKQEFSLESFIAQIEKTMNKVKVSQ